MNVARQDKHGSVWFHCPGCDMRHKIETRGSYTWDWNGDLQKPTFSPSVLATWDVGEEHIEKRCHSFVKVKDGLIQFLGDCTHNLSGQTVPLPPIE